MVMTGVTPILFYDPVNGWWRRYILTILMTRWCSIPGKQVTWDVNDTVLLDPKADPDVGGSSCACRKAITCRLGTVNTAIAWMMTSSVAAAKAAAHAVTPATAHLDTLGRTFLTIADNGGNDKFETRVDLDLEGNTLVVTDARHNAVMIYAVVQKDAQGKPV